MTTVPKTLYGRPYVHVEEIRRDFLVREKVPRNAVFMFQQDGYKFYALPNGTEVAVKS